MARSPRLNVYKHLILYLKKKKRKALNAAIKEQSALVIYSVVNII